MPRSCGQKRTPPNCASIGAKRLGIAFGVQTVKPWGLAAFGSVNVMTDPDLPLMVALQFIEDRKGDYKPDKYRGTNLMVRCAALVKKLGVKPGLYSARLDKPGLVIVDFSLRVPK